MISFGYFLCLELASKNMMFISLYRYAIENICRYLHFGFQNSGSSV